MIIQKSRFVLIETHKVKMQILNSIVIQNILRPYQLTQIKII